EAQAGRRRIPPRGWRGMHEPLPPEARAAIRQAWDVPIGNRYGMSGGVFAGFCGHGGHLPDDLCMFEPVGADGGPVPPGVPSQRVYVTNLYNHALPLIRFEVTDEVTVLDGTCPCGSAFRRIADPQGRLDDTFVYRGGVSVHPHVFRSSLGEHRQIIEYQVRQTERGADVRVVADAEIDAAVVRAKIEGALGALGLDQPEVTRTRVATLDRQASGKLKRFVPLSGWRPGARNDPAWAGGLHLPERAERLHRKRGPWRQSTCRGGRCARGRRQAIPPATRSESI